VSIVSTNSEPPTPESEPTGDPATSGAPSRRGLAVTATVVVACLLAAVVFGVWAVRSGGDGADDVTAGGAATGASDLHADHDGGDVLAGCDAEEYHHTMMMFDPLVADGLLESGCTWPYDATIAVGGGEEDPSIGAEFEPRRYAEIFDTIAEGQYGMCAVASLADERANGFVFGFRVPLNPAGCADGVSTFDVVIREYVTRAWRDTAASAASAEVVGAGTGNAVVLGRWVVSLIGDDAAAVDDFAARLIDLGGVAVSA
jgi:hypothetical protein